ncbi:MAG: hypothetical protein COA43_00560 [Robiginitomaculum sp.]|nr:MAG: hypothetical protein COA43_00560 [Robiginitomaculum sp.]
MPPTETSSNINLGQDDLRAALYRRLPVAHNKNDALLGRRFAQTGLGASEILGCEAEILTVESITAFDTLDDALTSFKTDGIASNSWLHQAGDFYMLACLSHCARLDGLHYTFSYYGPALQYPIAPNSYIAVNCRTPKAASATLAGRLANYKVKKTIEYLTTDYKSQKLALIAISKMESAQTHCVQAVKISKCWKIIIAYWKYDQNIPIICQGFVKSNSPIVVESVRSEKDAHDSLDVPIVLKTWRSKKFKYPKSAFKILTQMKNANIENAFINFIAGRCFVSFEYYSARPGLAIVSNEHRDLMKERLSAPLCGVSEQLDLNIGLFVNRELEPLDEGSGVSMS